MKQYHVPLGHSDDKMALNHIPVGMYACGMCVCVTERQTGLATLPVLA